MMVSVLFVTDETRSVLGTWGFNLCVIKGGGAFCCKNDMPLCFL